MTCEFLVARTGFEPVISALRGRRPEPLDERAIGVKRMAGTERIELPLTEPESVVLPLDEVPIGPSASTRGIIYLIDLPIASPYGKKLAAACFPYGYG